MGGLFSRKSSNNNNKKKKLTPHQNEKPNTNDNNTPTLQEEKNSEPDTQPKNQLDLKKEQEANHIIDAQLQRDEQKEDRTIGLLLLGAGGSGKSTVLKQMEKIYKGHIAQSALRDAVHYIRQNILEDIYDLSKTNLALRPQIQECQLTNDTNEEVAQRFAQLKGNQVENIQLAPELANEIIELWNDKGMQKTFEIRRRGHIMDNTPYFFDRIHKIADPSYKTTFDDYIRVRHRTTGIIEATFTVPFQSQEWIFRVTDVGGQRTERKKWLHCFADVHAVIYVMSLSSYDQVLFEDHSANCLVESLELFKRTAAQQVLHDTDFIVFLNKNDVFERKIKEVPFTEFYRLFPPKHAHDPNKVKDFIKNEYKARFYLDGNYDNKEGRKMHFHVTCATDTNQIQTVMHLIQFQTVRRMMQQVMML